ncbi:MAG: hypothetical protein E6I84_15885 [Chloroflexi bacterium]|nr:MAG: hypothetical protein E6I84_15885 [Chloroflexota bacterium]
MKSFNVWIRPSLFLGLWIAATSYTLSELVTVAPVLRSIPTQPQRTAGYAKMRTGARVQVVAR